MEQNLNNLFLITKELCYNLMQQKNVNIDDLSYKLGISRKDFINNFLNQTEDFTFYLQTVDLLEKWEV